ncbi:MAG: hypothetical protein HC811_12065 [Flammeovirgaceae bacterium]|nr:hypothetical protein [Flammeovirgaceae bacterium]
MPTIYVSRKGNSHNLRLRDSQGHDPGNSDLETDIRAGETVTWELDPRAGDPNFPQYKPIASIEHIEKVDGSSHPRYNGSIQLLTADPVGTNGILQELW